MIGIAPKRRKGKGKLHTHDPVPDAMPAFVPDVMTPPGANRISMKQPCEQCQAQWSARARRDVSGDMVPVYHRAFLVHDILWPWLERITEAGREVWDIWPVLPDVLFIWLCRDCYDAARASPGGFAQWAYDWRWAKGVSEVCREERDAAMGSDEPTALEVAEARNVAPLPGQWDGKAHGNGEAMLTERDDRLAILARWFAFSM